MLNGILGFVISWAISVASSFVIPGLSTKKFWPLITILALPSALPEVTTDNVLYTSSVIPGKLVILFKGILLVVRYEGIPVVIPVNGSWIGLVFKIS
jgi:hypothetical protein